MYALRFLNSANIKTNIFKAELPDLHIRLWWNKYFFTI